MVKALNKKSDKLTRSIQTLNDLLRQFADEDETWLELEPLSESRYHFDYNRRYRNMEFLGHAQTEGKWQLSVRKVEWEEAHRPGYPENQDPDFDADIHAVNPRDYPLIKASRQIRVEAAAAATLQYSGDVFLQKYPRPTNRGDT